MAATARTHSASVLSRRASAGTFECVFEPALFWSSTEDGANYAYYRFLFYLDANLYTNGYNEDDAMSVRCVKDH